MDSTDALFAENFEQKMSNPLAHFLAARSFLDRLTKPLAVEKSRFLAAVRIRPAPLIGFELRCVGACPPCTVAGNASSGNDQSSLEEQIILLGRQDGLRLC